MRFEKVWVQECRATKAITRHFGAKSALDYLIGEKLVSFADAACDHPAFARELPKFLAAVLAHLRLRSHFARRMTPACDRNGDAQDEGRLAP